MMRSAAVVSVRARLMLVVGVVLSVSCLVVPVARGAITIDSYGYLPGATFGSGGTGASAQHTGVAVEQSTGNIFLAEQVSQAVSVYAPDGSAGGTFLTTVHTSPQNFPQEVAVDPANGSLYVGANSFFGTALEKYVSDGAPTPAYTVDPAFVPSLLSPPVPNGLAVDPVSHDLLMADAGTVRVARVSAADGSLISSFDGADSAGGVFQNPGAVAVGPTGTIYVVDNGSRVERFASGGTSLGALSVGSGSDVTGVAVNPLSGDVVVAINRQNQTYLKGFTSGGTELFMTRFPTLKEVRGLAWDGGSDRIYVATNGGGAADTFVPADQPGVDAPVVSAVTGTSAHLAAEVAGAGQSTVARFEYCPATAACGDYPVSDPNPSGNPWVRLADHSVTGTATIEDDLPVTPSNSWRVRVSADSTYANGVVTDSTSSTVSFDSALAPPNVQTGAAASITTSSAELTGTIDTYGGQTTYHFEYGPTTAYGSRVPAGDESPAGMSRTPRVVSRPTSGLAPGTTYHFRLVATNVAGTTNGPDRTFVTAATPPPARGYEQVTPVDKKGGVINSRLGFQAAADGSAVSYTLAAPPTDAPSAVIFTRYLSRRGNDDWLRWTPTDPPLNVPRGVIEVTTQAISPDFNHALVVSNRALTAGAIDGGANIYVVDLRTRDYTLVGSAPGHSAYLAMAGLQTENMFLAGASDFSWITIISPRSLLPSAPPTAMYRWSRAGGLTLQSSPADSVQRPDSGNELLSRFVSDDGNTMYYDLSDGDGAVYRRVLGGAPTPVSVAKAGGAVAPDTVVSGRLDGVSRNGRYVVFRTATRLTADNSSSFDPFWMYRLDTQTGDLVYIGQPSDLSAGSVYAVGGDDAQTVFFHAAGSGSHSWRDGVTHAFTSSTLDLSGGFGVQRFASPNGRYLAYVDSQNSTVHLYDAATQTDVCVSCPPDGSLGARDFGLPGGTRTVSNRVPQVVNDNGLMFFDTAARLVSADHNGSRDVYSYQDGKLSLISPGDGSFTARFADATPDGSDVFFTTDQPLVGQDTDESIDVYDLRANSFNQSPPSRGGCARNDCREPNTGPVESPSPGSAPPQLPNQEEGPKPPKSSVGIKVTKVRVGSRSVRISFRASQLGRVQVSGTRVVKSVRNVAKAGIYSMTVPLTRKARQLHAAHRRFKVSVKVTLTGDWGSSSAKFSRTLGK
ncbi:hypothetical protein [Baekduia sp. Peel2402]|uniref:hypothetical protein n=1 Tax=Baekduia sp. Peel2402 TaxID=3458296 RepID=UPI00403EB710